MFKTIKTSADTLRKACSFTDIHWGCKSNSIVHNLDNINYVKWFCDLVKQDSSIDHIVFMGDWFENRSALNVSTIHYAQEGARLLNDLGLPIFFIVGNHDLYHRNTREIFSTVMYNQFSNFIIIDQPTIVENVGSGGALFSPFLFHEEYPLLQNFLKLKTWWGHFEFKGFVITGYSTTMNTGPDPSDYIGPTRVFSGHFHKRQEQQHVVYIGNTFPTNFGDAGDNARGLMVYDHDADTIKYHDWLECPKYARVKLTDLLDDKLKIHTGMRIKCISDIPITFEESSLIKQKFTDDYSLREFILEESREIKLALTETDADLNISLDETSDLSIDELIIHMLKNISSDHIDNNILIEQYQQLKL